MYVEKCLLVLAVILCVSISAIQSAPVISNLSYVSSLYDESGVCNTTECIRSAELIRNNMDSNIDPCDDFYKFACGHYMSVSEVTNYDTLADMQELTLNQLRNILEGSITDADLRPLQMAKEFYDSCLREDTVEIFGTRHIYEKIKEIGDWPMKYFSADEKDSFWIETIRISRNLGFYSNYLASVFIHNNPKNSSVRILTIGPPVLAVPAFILKKGLSDPGVKKYMELMTIIGMQFRLYSDEFSVVKRIARQSVDVQEILKFEIELAEISPSLSEAHEELFTTFSPVSIGKAQELYPSLNWVQYMQAMIGPDVPIDKNEEVRIMFPEFVNKLNQLITRTPKRIIVNYLLWRYILFSLKVTFGIKSQLRWKTCVSYTLTGFHDVIAAKYIRSYFPKENKGNVLEIIKRIKQEIRTSLSNSQWIDDITRKNALEKLEAIAERVGYSEDILKSDYGSVIDTYKNLHISSKNYYESVLNISKFVLHVDSLRLRQPDDRLAWPSCISPMMVNALYYPGQNSIIIPAAILQKVFYSSGRPSYLNYGAIGFIIGHELSHAFDDYGSHFDKYGNLNDWWEPQTKERCAETVKCFVDQYSSYKIHEIDQYVDGKVTLDENIADNEGIKKAYYAYKSWVKEHGAEKRLPGLDYTPQQLFWISSANVWCSKYAPSTLHYLQNIDNHAPHMIRVKGQVSNQKEFAEDFSCASGSKMNPVEKCAFW